MYTTMCLYHSTEVGLDAVACLRYPSTFVCFIYVTKYTQNL